jgi:CheY-like chemotaxis protein
MSRPVHVLLVDDDEVDVLSVQRACTRAGIDAPLWIARDGLEGLAMLRGTSLPKQRRLVLLDLNLPRMNGIELLREIRGDPALNQTRVVVLTTSNQERDRTDAYGLDVAGYLVKPVTFEKLVEMIAALHHYWQLVEFP